MSEILYQNLLDTETEKCWEALSMVRDEMGREVSARLHTNIQILNMAADTITGNADLADQEAVLSYLTAVQRETIFDRIDIVFPDGTVLLQCGERVKDVGDKTYDERIAQESHLSQRSPDFYTEKDAIHAFAPVYDVTGTPIALLGATVYCASLAETFTSAHYGEDAELFLVDLRDGNFVLDTWHPELGNIRDLGDRELLEKYKDIDFVGDIMAGKAGYVGFVSQINGKSTYMTYAPVKDTDFSLAMFLQDDVVFKDVNELRSTMMLVGAIEVVLLVVFAIWLYFVLLWSIRNKNRAQQAEFALWQQKEQELERQYADAADRQEFLETMAENLPGGYHRCTTDHTFRLSFISKSFTQVTGYTMEQLRDELNYSYMGIVAPEDREYFLSLAPQLENDGHIQCAYRMRRRDGSIRWVQDSTQYIERDGEQYYQCALTDITEQIEELERAKQQAEASSQAKSVFLFNISHDIRTPMNAIKGFSHIIEENAHDPRLVLETIGKIQQAGDSLMMLMNDVLDIARIERGKEEINLQPMELLEHGKNLYEMFAADMQAAGIQFLAGGDCLDDLVYCDALKLTRIMMNMLSNAKKFTPAGGTVTFGGYRLRRDETSCTYRFFVRDTGIGMSSEFQKRAFQQFERERTSTESGIAGSGLGLAIIKMLVELMDGTVEIQSELGKGTEIAATLTFQLAGGLKNRKEITRDHSVLDMTGKRVLLVEDNDFNREIARYVLEGMHFTVEEAQNGAICIEKLMSAAANDFDLILMDIQMPVMDGYTATVEIRNMSDRQKAAIPIIAMTANAFEEDKRKCMEVGMNGHVGKPVDVDALMQLLSGVL